MAETINIKVNFDDGGAANSLGGLEDKLDNLKESIRGVEVGSEEFKRLANEISKTESSVKDLELSFEGLDMEQKSSEFGSFAAGLADTATGALALSSAMGITDASSEKMIETLVSGMAVANTFRGGLDGIISLQKLLRSTTVSSAAAQRVLNAVMNANPIGLLVTAITALIAGFAAYSIAIKNTNKAQKALNDVTDTAIENAATELSALDKLGKTIDDENKTREEKVQAVKDLQKEYPDLLSNIDAEKSSTEELNRAIELNSGLVMLQAKLKATQELRVEAYKQLIQEETEAMRGNNVGILEYAQAMLFSTSAQAEGNQQTKVNIAGHKEQISVLDMLSDGFENQIKSIKEGLGIKEEDTKKTKKSTEAIEKNNEKLKTRQELLEEYLAFIRGIREEETRVEDLLNFEVDIDDIEAPELPTYKPFQLPEGEPTPTEIAQQEADQLIAIQQENLDNQYINERQFADRKLQVEEHLSERIKAIKKEEAQVLQAQRQAQLTGALNAGAQLLGAIAANAEEGSKAQENALVAQSIMQGATGAITAFSQAMTLGPIAGPIVGGVLVAAIAATTASNIKKIKSARSNAGGGGGGSIAAPPSVNAVQQTPDVNLFGNANEGSEGDASMFNSQNSQPQQIQAVVQWSDIENVQNQNSSLQQEMQL